MSENYKTREACFICSSPYQIINAISIITNKEMDADLYIFGAFPGYEIIAEKLGAYSLFTSIHAIDLIKIGAKGKSRALKELFFAERTVGRFLDKNIAYHSCYYTSRSSLKSAMLKVLLKRNPGMKRIVFEEGMGTYSDRGNLLSVSKTRCFLEKMLKWNIDNPETTVILAYIPELVHYKAPFDQCVVSPLPRLNLTETNRKMLCDVFSVPDDGSITERCVIFDSKRSGPSLLETDQMLLMDQCYEIIAQYLGKEHVILKPHPRSVEKSSCDLKTYLYQGIPMEILYAEMPDLEHRILVSFVSSAVFTPKILFDAEPTVICLHNIIRDNRISKNFGGIFEKFKDTYRHRERVFSPDSTEELKSYLEAVKSQV